MSDNARMRSRSCCFDLSFVLVRHGVLIFFQFSPFYTRPRAMNTSVPKTILLADNHNIVREGLRALINMFNKYRVIGESCDGEETVVKYQELHPDLTLMDLSMPLLNGALATKKIISLSPEAKILILTAHYADEYLYSTLEAGAKGYILKDQPSKDLIQAIDTILEGDYYMSPKVSSHLVHNFISVKRLENFDPGYTNITTRERQVLSLIAEGRKSRDISERLHISVKTVEKHRSNLLKKTGLHCAVELSDYAVKHGLVISPKLGTPPAVSY